MTRPTPTVLGVGIGTSSSKGVLADLEGHVLRQSAREHTVATPRPGWFEMDAQTWWHESSALTTQAAAAKIAWVADVEPERFPRARWFYSPGSWLVRHLTGTYVLDHDTASQWVPLYEVHAQDWYRPWADPIIGDIELPRLRWPGEIAGRVSMTAAEQTGLAAGIPVITGTVDAWAEAINVDAHRVGDLMLMYGTTMLLVNTVDQPVVDPSLWGPVGALPGTRSLAGGMATAGSITAQLRELFGAPGFPVLLAEAERSGVGAHGLLMLPYFAGERTPIMDPDARGVIAGLTLSHTRGDLYRAALEAIALGVRDNVEAMVAAEGNITRVVAVGGGTKGGLWPQIVSDVTGRDQVIPSQTIGASYGGALLAAQTIADIDIQQWNRPERTCHPREGNWAAYDHLFGLYRAAVRREPRRGACVGPPDREVPHRARHHSHESRRYVMSTYHLPTLPDPVTAEPGVVWTVASGDLRLSANQTCWPVQQKLEGDLTAALTDLGWTVHRAHDVDPVAGHGFISSQRMGMEVFRTIPPDAPLIVVEAVWQYSHHVLAGLRHHRGPILLVANWVGDFPGLVGMLNLAASLTKAGVPYSSLWSKDFTDEWARNGLRTWLETGTLEHDLSHVRDLPALPEDDETALGRALAEQLRADKAILGVFDEGCMGMYNAIFDDELINPLGIYKERLSQSALVAEMNRVDDAEAQRVHEWLIHHGMTFHLGTDEATELTQSQLNSQYKMYVAALRIADDFGLDGIGIQYQQGLKDTVPASDLAEGLLNNVERPPVMSRDGARELYAGRALPHFNEVDWGSGVDSLVTNRIWRAMGLDPATTLHDIRWGEEYDGRFVWVLEISGSVPASHNGGYEKSYSMRQPPMYFPLGGGTLSGVSRPGEIVWSRIFIMEGVLHADLGRGSAVELPAEETRRRLEATTPQWPIMHLVLHGVGRDQLMARHRANHMNVVYAPSAEDAGRALRAKAAMLQELGIRVHLCGQVSV